MIREIITVGGEALEVTASAEHAPRAGDDDRADGRVFIALQGGVHQVPGQIDIERVGRIRPVQGDTSDAITDIEQKGGVWHVNPPSRVGATPRGCPSLGARRAPLQLRRMISGFFRIQSREETPRWPVQSTREKTAGK